MWVPCPARSTMGSALVNEVEAFIQLAVFDVFCEGLVGKVYSCVEYGDSDELLHLCLVKVLHSVPVEVSVHVVELLEPLVGLVGPARH